MLSLKNPVSGFVPQEYLFHGGALLAAIILSYLLGLVVYRLHLSPLAQFPGPKLAAVTVLYEQFYDVIHKGQFTAETERLHDKYGTDVRPPDGLIIGLTNNFTGPIVRINPHELSIRDPEYYDQLYVAGSVRSSDRDAKFVPGLVDFEGTHLATTDHYIHGKRRKPLDPYFSRHGFSKLESSIVKLVESLAIDRFQAFRGTGKVVRLDHAFTSFSGDAITMLCSSGNCANRIDDPDFMPDWYNLLYDGVVTLPLVMALPWLIRLIRHIPDRLVVVLNPRLQKWNDLKAI